MRMPMRGVLGAFQPLRSMGARASTTLRGGTRVLFPLYLRLVLLFFWPTTEMRTFWDPFRGPSLVVSTWMSAIETTYHRLFVKRSQIYEFSSADGFSLHLQMKSIFQIFKASDEVRNFPDRGISGHMHAR